MAEKTNRSRRRDRVIVGVAIVAFASGIFGAVAYAPAMAKTAPVHNKVQPIVQTGVADLVEAVSPAVVAISTSGKSAFSGVQMPEFNLPPGSPFEEFFRRFFKEPGFGGQGRGEGLPPAHKYNAQGSGFIIQPEGVVVTNHHVVKGAEKITVITQSGEEYEADLKGFDSKTDLAVLEIETDKPLPYVAFGDSNDARVGDWVLAIGNPFGLGGTATTGIISARGRDINSGPLDDFLQIDAPINRGNSGGPLFDTKGEVIGVNTAIFSPNGGSVGIGFAIPSSMAASVVDQLIAKGHVERGWLGVQIQKVTEELAESLGLSEEKGALVAAVVDGSPADKAGVKVGDVILTFDGKTVDKMRDLPHIVAETAADSTVDVDVWRNGSTRGLSVTVGESKQSEPVELGSNQTSPKGKLGLTLAELNEQTRSQYRIDEDTQGVLVVRVSPDSPAAEKGIRSGDVIKMVGNAEVSDPGEVIAEVSKATEKDRKLVLLLVERNGNDRFVAVNIA